MNMTSLTRVWGRIPPGYKLILPAVLILGLFQIYPIIDALAISFKHFDFLNPSAAHWVGLQNYLTLFRQISFRAAIGNTAFLLIFVVPSQTILGFGLALLLNSRLRGRDFFRTIYFLPYVSPPVAIAAIVSYLFTINAPATLTLMNIFHTPDVPWYATSPYALVLVALITIWMQTGLYMVLYLSGLQTIPRELYEAGAIDGASSWQMVRHVTVPLLRPTTFLITVMGIIATLQIFDVPYMVSSIGGGVPGGPGNSTMTMVMYLYTEAFTNFNMGLASAAAFVIFGAIFVLTLIQYQFLNSGQT